MAKSKSTQVLPIEGPSAHKLLENRLDPIREKIWDLRGIVGAVQRAEGDECSDTANALTVVYEQLGIIADKELYADLLLAQSPEVSHG